MRAAGLYIRTTLIHYLLILNDFKHLPQSNTLFTLTQYPIQYCFTETGLKGPCFPSIRTTISLASQYPCFQCIPGFGHSHVARCLFSGDRLFRISVNTLFNLPYMIPLLSQYDTFTFLVGFWPVVFAFLRQKATWFQCVVIFFDFSLKFFGGFPNSVLKVETN